MHAVKPPFAARGGLWEIFPISDRSWACHGSTRFACQLCSAHAV